MSGHSAIAAALVYHCLAPQFLVITEPINVGGVEIVVVKI